MLLLFSSQLLANCGCSNCILKDKLETSDKRYATFDLAIKLLNQKVAPTVVETGIARYGRQNCKGDGCSTIIFAEWARDHGGSFYSVDIDQKAIEKAKQGLAGLNPYVTIAWQDSISFLQNFPRTIDFLYLDSYDFEAHNPTPSQLHHLKEIHAAYPHLAQDAIVMIDDCDLPHGGKCKYVVEFLLSKGWKILAKGYQIILARG
jgi:hypothetical protein